MTTFLLIVLLIIVARMVGSSSKARNTLTCDKRNIQHKWVWKGEDGNMYHVCEVCKVLAGGGKEEGRDER